MSLKRIHPLKAFRQAHKLNQVAAAERFGISQGEWSRIERGIKRPSVKLTKRLVRETGVSLDILMGIAS